VAITDALLGQGIDVRGNGIRMPVASEDGTHVLRRDPKYVWLAEKLAREKYRKREKKDKGLNVHFLNSCDLFVKTSNLARRRINEVLNVE